ncbi:MAG: GntR family transcriptional regulator [bacterium]
MNQTNLTLADQAYRILEEMIVTLELPPGSAYSEADLSQKINIGRTPLRQALQKLADHRLVASLPRRGIIVSEVNIAEHLALLETRRVLDRLVVSRAARRANPDQRQELKSCAREILQAAATGDVAEFMCRDQQFDQIVETASRNIFAARACAPLHAHCRRFWYLYQENGDLSQSAKLHAAVMKAVVVKDESAAANASDQLMDYLEQFTRAALELF